MTATMFGCCYIQVSVCLVWVWLHECQLRWCKFGTHLPSSLHLCLITSLPVCLLSPSLTPSSSAISAFWHRVLWSTQWMTSGRWSGSTEPAPLYCSASGRRRGRYGENPKWLVQISCLYEWIYMFRWQVVLLLANGEARQHVELTHMQDFPTYTMRELSITNTKVCHCFTSCNVLFYCGLLMFLSWSPSTHIESCTIA